MNDRTKEEHCHYLNLRENTKKEGMVLKGNRDANTLTTYLRNTAWERA